MLKKATEETGDPYLALLNYRATPLKGGMSPAELSMGRKLRTRLPDAQELQDVIASENDTPVSYNAHAKALPTLEEGDIVRIRDNVRGLWAQKAQVSAKHQNPRSYLVKTENGKFFRRNRRDLRKTAESMDNEQEPTEDQSNRATSPQQEVYEQPPPSLPAGDIQPSAQPTPSSTPSVNQDEPCYRTRVGRLVNIPNRYKE